MPTVVVKHTGSATEAAAVLRRRERGWLLAASVVVAFGLLLTYSSKTEHFDETRAQLESDGQRHPDLDGLAALLARLKLGLAHDAEGLLVAPGPNATDNRRLGHVAVFIDDKLQDDAAFDARQGASLRLLTSCSEVANALI